MKKICSILFLSFCFLVVSAQTWPVPSAESKAGARWWWMGSAVDKENLQWSISEYAKHGIGALEITPIYGVQGLQDRNIEYLSDKWFEMLRYTMEQCERNGIELDMATGTGWPFGGPWVPLKESSCKAVFVEREFTGDEVKNLDLSVPEKERKNAFLEKVMLYADGQAIDVTAFVNAKDGTLSLNASQASTLRSQASTLDSRASTLRSATSGDASLAQNAQLKKVIALYIKYGVMKVKRPSAGGEGLVVDHFDKTAVAHYLKHISDAFDRTHTPYPHTFFNDSYEVEAATWTPLLLKEFEQRRGYRLEDHFPELLSSVQKSATSDNAKAAQHSTLTPQQILSDYRETLGDLLLENFTEQWTAWAHAHGAITRNQAHGSPANLIDCYAAVDIPEIEGFGLSDLGINGLRKDPGNTRKNGVYTETGSKTYYDPCPAGWRVPALRTFQGFTPTGGYTWTMNDFNVVDVDNDGEITLGDWSDGWQIYLDKKNNVSSYFPATTRYDGQYAMLMGSMVGLWGNYWYNTPGENTDTLVPYGARAVSFSIKDYNGTELVTMSALSTGSRADAYAVRCIKE